MSNKNQTWTSCVQLDDKISKILKDQADRAFCKFTFKNNLEDKYTIDYIKISHVFEGRDAFVYEYTNLEYDQELIINEYAIGVDTSAEYTGSVNVSLKTDVDKDRDKKKDKNNVYDRLYIHFVINRNGQQELFHHCYEQFLDRHLMDLITVNGNVSEKMLALTNINLYFDPNFDKYDPGNKNEMYKLILHVIAPALDGERINIKPAILR